MSEDEKRGSQSRDFAVATGAQVKLYEAVKAHKFDLEITEGVWALDQEIMDRRIEAAQQLLEWLEQELKLSLRVSQRLPYPILKLASGTATLATRRRI
jgi:hypothetical protein